MMKTETVILAAGAIQPLDIAGRWFRVRNLEGGTEPYVKVKALSTNGGKQLADGLTAYDGDLFGWDEAFRGITFTNPTAVEITFEVIISDEGRHDVSRPAVAILGAVGYATLIGSLNDETINAGETDALEGQIGGVGMENLSEVTIQADANNPNLLRVGGSLVGAANGYVLQPGAEKTFRITGTDTNLSVHNPAAGAPCVYRLLCLSSPTTL